MTELEDFLAHYGVRGMRWGVRKKPTRDSHPESDDYKRVKELRTRRPSTLSNQELKTLNERRNLEQNYNRLNPNTVHRGERQLKAVIGTIGTLVAAQTLYDNHGRAMREVGSRFISQAMYRITSGIQTHLN